jgi:ribonuclease D
MVRRVAWEPPAEVSVATVSEALLRSGARPWQVKLVAGPIAEALPTPAALATAVPPHEPE